MVNKEFLTSFVKLILVGLAQQACYFRLIQAFDLLQVIGYQGLHLHALALATISVGDPCAFIQTFYGHLPVTGEYNNTKG